MLFFFWNSIKISKTTGTEYAPIHISFIFRRDDFLCISLEQILVAPLIAPMFHLIGKLYSSV
ncbi:hypothetical protein AI20_01460 [Aeromonas hydrophila YL17]|nr:hypothetical protein AI20_01460 [Aeromonas hydrophila YL17]